VWEKFGFGLDMGEKSVSEREVICKKKMTHQKKLDDKMLHTSKSGAVCACLHCTFVYLGTHLVEQALMDRFLACLHSSHHSFSLSVCVSIVVQNIK